MRAILAALTFLALAACASRTPKAENGMSPPTQEEYAAAINKHTVRTNQYAGFYQTFQADMTILSTEMQSEALRQRAYFMQWDTKQLQTEKEKILQDATAYARFFLRFYSPEREYDDLHKGKTIWKVYLDYGGQRFEGKVRKMTEKFVELQTLYPHLDRFSTPYEITFNVPMSRVETGPSKVVLTSSLGSAEFSFPMAK